jgi:L-threonylcarbamoyladenylate synthase
MREDSALFRRAARIVQSGGLIIVATETFYALAAPPFREDAVRKVFRVKSRLEDKPLPLIAADRYAVDKIAPRIPETARKLMERFWPGSLTILLEAALPMSRLLTGPTGKIGVRVPPPCPARTIAELTGGWITATSANLSGHPNPQAISRIASQVLDSVDLVLNSGPTLGGEPSTVIEPLESGIRVVRQGAVSVSVLQDFLRQEGFSEGFVL